MSDTQDRGKAPSVPPASAQGSVSSQSSIPPPTDDIDSDWGSEPEAPPPLKSAPPAKISLTPETRRSEPGPAPEPSSPPPGSTRPKAPDLPELKRSRTLMGIAAPILTETPAPQPNRSRTLIGIPAPTLSTAPEPRKDGTLLGTAPQSDEAPATQPSESPIAAAVQDFLGEKPTTSPSSPVAIAQSKPPPPESKPPAAESKPPASAKPAESKSPAGEDAQKRSSRAITRREPLSKLTGDRAAPSSSETATEVASADGRKGNGSIWAVLLIAAGLAGVGFWLMSSAEKAAEPPAEQAKVEPPPPSPAAPPAPAAAPAELAPAPAPTPAPAPSSEPVAPIASASAAAPAASASASAEPPAGDVRRVIVTARPAEAKFYRKGKKVSGSPMTVDLAPGEKRAFEVGLPGFVTRKVVVDGTRPEILVGLQPQAAAPPPTDTGP